MLSTLLQIHDLNARTMCKDDKFCHRLNARTDFISIARTGILAIGWIEREGAWNAINPSPDPWSQSPHQVQRWQILSLFNCFKLLYTYREFDWYTCRWLNWTGVRAWYAIDPSPDPWSQCPQHVQRRQIQYCRHLTAWTDFISIETLTGILAVGWIEWEWVHEMLSTLLQIHDLNRPQRVQRRQILSSFNCLKRL
jgi:hypothetical protein